MGLLSSKDYVALEDAKISSRPRVTTENAKQFGLLTASLSILRIGIPLEDMSSHKKLTEIQELVETIWNDLNYVDYV